MTEGGSESQKTQNGSAEPTAKTVSHEQAAELLAEQTAEAEDSVTFHSFPGYSSRKTNLVPVYDGVFSTVGS